MKNDQNKLIYFKLNSLNSYKTKGFTNHVIICYEQVIFVIIVKYKSTLIITLLT